MLPTIECHILGQSYRRWAVLIFPDIGPVQVCPNWDTLYCPGRNMTLDGMCKKVNVEERQEIEHVNVIGHV